MKELREAIAEFKRGYLMKVVKANNGNISVTAKKLGNTRNTLIININMLKLKNEVKKVVVEYRNLRKQLKRKPARITAGKVEYSKKNLLKEAANEFIKKYIKKAFKEMQGSVSKTAKMLKVHRNNIIYKINDFKLRDYLNEVLWEKRRKNKHLMYYHTVVKPLRQKSASKTNGK
jgi:DNA-binding NtrC family response regulator